MKKMVAPQKRMYGVGMAVTLAVLLAGCTSGSITSSQQSCRSSGGFLGEGKISCTGSAGTLKGEPTLSIAGLDEDFGGTYRLEATVELGKGVVTATVATADGKRGGGQVTPGKPLRISEDVSVDSTDDELDLSLEVTGKQAEDLRYRATLTPRG